MLFANLKQLTCSMLSPTAHSLPFHNLSRTPSKHTSFKQISQPRTLDEAFRSLGTLFSDRTSLPLHTNEVYSPILELCAREKALSQGQQIHAHVIKSQSLSDSAFLSTKLLFMYGKCGSFDSAEMMFDGMPERTIFSWNAMIGACVSNGEPFGALEMYREMRSFGVPLDSCTFPCIVKACAALDDLRCGTEIHGLAIKCGFDSVSFVTNSLVSMYSKCGDLDAARMMFDEMAVKDDIVLLNSMISAYSSSGKGSEALGLFREIKKSNVPVNEYTYVSALLACKDSEFEKSGMEIHAETLKSSHCLDVYVANALLAMYVRSGKMVDAARVFNNMEFKDNVSYNTMLSGFVQNGFHIEAMQLFRDMRVSGKRLDEVAVLNIIAACGRLGNLLNGMEIHAYALKKGLDLNLLIGNTLIDMYAKCGCASFMGCAFSRMPVKDSISWTTIIAGYANNNVLQMALEMFRRAQSEGVDVDPLMIESVLIACRGLNRIDLVKQIHGHAIRGGLFDRVLKNTIVNVYGEYGFVEYANRVFERIELKDVVSCTSMLTCFVHNGLANEAFELFESMRRDKVELDSVALVSILSATASLSSLNKGREIHAFLIRKLFIFDGSVLCSLVEMYASCGNLESASKVYRRAANNRDLILWTSMINAYGIYGHGKKAIELFTAMENEGIIPDHVAFLAILYACSHSGLVDEGKRYFHNMTEEYQLEPWAEHYACFVDLLGRGNRLAEAYQFVTSMKTEPTVEVWCTLLGACRVHGDKELGEIVAKKLLELRPENPGSYVLISNVLASNGRWRDVKKVRMKMKGRGLKKIPGCSWIEIGNEVHAFVARDKCHPESVKIYKKLARVTELLEREAGYVAQTGLVLHDVEEEEKVKMLHGHSERLAIAYGLIRMRSGTPIRITKNLRICSDCHDFSKLVSKFFGCELVVRDANRFHHFKSGSCSCGDFW